VKFLLDAQLPPRLAQELHVRGHHTLHTIHLPLRNRTPDGDIAALATREGRVLVTKDSDFVTSFLLHRRPHKLLLISTGNVSNDILLRLILENLSMLDSTLSQYDFVELNRFTLTIHS
jgi:predicted nuclease of predicted toxin-antitoxin system